jgi:hypothetical protein
MSHMSRPRVCFLSAPPGAAAPLRRIAAWRRDREFGWALLDMGRVAASTVAGQLAAGQVRRYLPTADR